MDYTEKKLKKVNRYDGIIVSVEVDNVLLSNGHTTMREVVSHPGGVTVIPVDDDGMVYCVRQYRYPFGTHMIETPAGKLEPGEDPMQCAVRELSEETGITAGRIIDLGEIYTSPGFSNEVLHAYLARDLSFGDSHPDDGELLNVEKLPLEKLERMTLSGEIKDAKTVIAVLKAARYMEGKDGPESPDSRR